MNRGPWRLANIRIQPPRESPIDHLHLAESPHHHVQWFEIAMDDALRVGIGDRLGDLFEDLQEPGQLMLGRRPLAEQFGQRAALNQLHAEKRTTVGQAADLMHGRNARMLKLPRDTSFLEEPFYCGAAGLL